MGQAIELTAADGHRLGAWLATPQGKPRGALVVVQEIFGVNSHIRSVADGYAADGYLAIAPALFDRAERGVELGYTPEDQKRGFALKAASADDKALLDIAAALAHVQHAGRAGIVGYCWGGTLTWLSAGKLDGFSAAVPYYGGGMASHAQVAPKCPVLGHFGEQDTHIPVEGIRALQQANAAKTTVHFYPAGHGFNCDQRGSYDAASARLARDRTLAFLHQHVG
jgi:carboxymethylenebutenolidase